MYPPSIALCCSVFQGPLGLLSRIQPSNQTHSFGATSAVAAVARPLEDWTRAKIPTALMSIADGPTNKSAIPG